MRSDRERHESHTFVSYFATYCYGREPWITINAFSMGAWATGLNMGLSLQKNGLVKNTGPDIAKVLHTLRFFGPEHTYLICGYPPFLKHLIDVGKAEGFPFEQYTLLGLAGGEGMSEGLRDYLLRRFKKVYSGYGATDLEIGIAARARPDLGRIGAVTWLGHREGAVEGPVQQRVQPAALLLLGGRERESTRRSRSPGPGCRTPAARALRAEDLVHQRELDLAEPLVRALVAVRGPRSRGS